MIDDILRADSARWNSQQGPAPDLDAAISSLDRRVGVPRSRRMLLSGLAAASVVGAAAAVVVISASTGQGHHVAGARSTATNPAAPVTRVVLRPVTVTQTANVTSTVVLTKTERVSGSEQLPPVTHTVTTTSLLTAQVTAAEIGATTPASPTVLHLDVTKATPVIGHARALLASLGLFIVIAGAWGIGRRQRRRAH